ncbi:uncharacterized protein SPAPADRAFT_143912 [Spathaspora passalidarum NRRL Y-27907]|uniref:Uncharacterized protein n=1 Tax=Spathaspora passalidarum (strain NRRL Y-27907 / 11-Y1) TaxID=619300 RepID=G3AVU7_SPAPN|nr:uncharacterized protein SPAPADRAFT_143912 [Spathaspora passalidarum NRRL Y-27907]EGW29992.1 hypothetical protein SPAPADRAFT_143912 [Spathaspora passalidarum NRRL Y-27907]
MEESNPSQSFYIQTNGSSSSRIHLPGVNKPSANVSSVGFNTLKKMATNSSSSSITTSSSTSRTNPLTKLFSKNKSVSSLLPQATSELSLKEGDDQSFLNDSNSSMLTYDSKKGGTNKFRISRRLKFKNKGKPDLTIQTTGHHGIRLPKKIVSSTSLNESNSGGTRKNSLGSPVSTFHSFFHRSHALSSPLEPTNSKAKIDEHTNNTRSALCLSSNSSNSYIADIKLASIYKFTDPNYSIDETEGTTDYALHKKMLLPADSFFQSRAHKNSQDGTIPVSDDSETESIPAISDFSKTNARFLGNLMNVIKPLFLVPIRKNSEAIIIHPYLGYSTEDIASFIKENLFEESKHSPETSISSPNKSKPKHKTGLNNLLTLPNDSAEDLDYFRAREISQDVQTLFIKCLTIFRKDITNMNFNDSKSKLPPPSTKGLVTDLSVSWQEISFGWTHFNKKIRFYILSLFEPLQGCFDTVSQYKFNSSSDFPPVNFEKELILAFRDAILVPFLLERKQKYFEFTGEDTVSDPESSYHTLFLDEQAFLKENSHLVSVLIDCFASISCHTLSGNGSLTADGEQFYVTEIIRKTFTWLSSLSLS